MQKQRSSYQFPLTPRSLDRSSTWEQTADTYITSFDDDASTVVSNGYTLYVNGTAMSGTK